MKNSYQYKLGIHIFHRDLRLEDNTSLINLLEICEKVIPCFIFDDRQLKKNPYKGNPSLQFLINSLIELDIELKSKNSQLYIFSGKSDLVMGDILKKYPADIISSNRDYTPFAILRDSELSNICEKQGVKFISHSDALLHEPEQISKDDGKPYTIFTPYFRKAKQVPVAKIKINGYSNYYTEDILNKKKISFLKKIFPQNNSDLVLIGGRKEGLNLLSCVTELEDYKVDRDFPILDKTSHLSSHNKFGTISIREFYYKVIELFSNEHTLIAEIYWRDFFTHIAYHFPRVFKGSFREKYNEISWPNDERFFKAWCEGKTGFPIVDAGMRELNKTGYMHNRLRMVVASFLVKDLHVSWRKGEKYFATKLLDYDPSVNNGNWQWASSTGCDAQPYFRIFNPWRQQLRFDSDCKYIKKWLPELSDLEPKEIHKLEIQRPVISIDYPSPIVVHKESSTQTKFIFSSLK